MRKRLWALQTVFVAGIVAGCNLNMSDVSFSNFGNGNALDTNLNANVNGGNGPGYTPSPAYSPHPAYSPYPGYSPSPATGQYQALTFDRQVYRVRLGYDPRVPSFAPGGTSSISLYPDPAAQEEATVRVTATYYGGSTMQVDLRGSDWKWVLPENLEQHFHNPYYYSNTSFLLVAKPEAQGGIYTIKLESTWSPGVIATASVVDVDAGAVDVVIE